MKRFISALAIMIAVCFTACSADSQKNIAYDKLPAKVKTFVSTHFADKSVSYIESEKEKGTTEYEINFTDGSIVEVYADATWQSIECMGTGVPAALIPQAIAAYVKVNYPGAKIVEISKDSRGYEVELNNRTELKFDNGYNFLRIDD